MREERVPPSIRGAICTNTGGKVRTNFFEASGYFSGCGFSGRDVLLLDLLLNESAADQAIESLLLRVPGISIGAWIEDGKLHFMFEIALQDYLAINHSNDAIQCDAV